MHRILAIGADQQVLEHLCAQLQQEGYLPQMSTAVSEAIDSHWEEGPELVLVVLPLKDYSGRDLIVRLKAQDPRSTIVVCGQDAEITGAPAALKLGALEHIGDPMADFKKLLSAIRVGLDAKKSDIQLRFLRKKDAAGTNWVKVVCESPAMRKVLSTVRQIGHRTASGGAPSILVTGETGTGKGLIAKTIHYNSARRSRAFVDINCAAIPPSLIEAEIFGHGREAYTGAQTSRAGLFETADGGTFFLDEIGVMPLELQAKLLIMLEEKSVRRLGTTRGIKVDVQVIAATSRDLESMVAQGDFRADLYHRLKVVSLDLPPLRDRGQDKLLLAKEFIRTICQEYGVPEKELSEDAQSAIMKYDWPGNVRELRNQIERIILLADEDLITARHFVFASSQAALDLDMTGDQIRISLPDDGLSLDKLEREVIRQALKKHGGNVSHTARYLGITRHTLIYRIEKHGID